jgi:4-hydroxybenzoate polyprenyltransferase
MGILDILIVLFYTLKPYWWLIVLALMVLVVSFYLGKKAFTMNPVVMVTLSVFIGVVVGLAAPCITHSQLSYVTTMTDWVALVGIMVVVAIYCWINMAMIVRK